MMFIDRAAPTYQGEPELYFSELSSFLSYLIEVINYNATQAAKIGQEGGEP